MRHWKHVIGLVIVLVGVWFALNRLALAVQPPSLPEGEYGSWEATAIQVDFQLLEMASPTSGWAIATRTGDRTYANQSLMFEYADGNWNWRQTLEGPEVTQIEMVSPTDGWLVGNDQKVGTIGTGRAYHYSDGAWNPVIAPEDVFLGIDMVSPGEGFVLGVNRLWRLYNGATSWQGVGPGVYDYPFNYRTYSKFQVISANNMWYLTSSLYDWSQGSQHILYHYDGVRWNRSFAHPDLRAFKMVNNRDGWLIGDEGQIWRYNGVEWVPQISPTTANLWSVDLAGSDEAWAIGSNQTALHFDGSAWQVVQLPTNGQVISMLDADEGWIAGRNSWMRSLSGNWEEYSNNSKPVLGAPWNTQDAVMLANDSVWTSANYFDGQQWLPHEYNLSDSLFAVQGPFERKFQFGFEGLAMASPTAGWTIGQAVAFSGTSDYQTANLLFAFDGSQWTAQETPATVKESLVQSSASLPRSSVQTPGYLADLRQRVVTPFGWLTDLSLAAPEDLWFSSSTGYVLRYTGGEWSTSRDAAALDNEDSTTELMALDMLSPQAGWAVGNKIVHYDGQQWITSLAVSDTLWAVDMLSPTLGMAAGENGMIMHYNGSSWQPIQSPTQADLTDIQMVAPDDAWAIGSLQGAWNGFAWSPNSGVILHYNGENWQMDAILPYDKLTAIALLDSDSGHVFGDGLVLALKGTKVFLPSVQK